jgi:hypothetical protein|tara:strand:- start:48 stop:389 length:342 start_codon:yes stop_codon:yes gene_type:complete
MGAKKEIVKFLLEIGTGKGKNAIQKAIDKFGKKDVFEAVKKHFSTKADKIYKQTGAKPKVDEIKWKPVKTKKDYSKIEKEVTDLAKKTYRPMSAGGTVNSRAIAKKYFKGGLV